MMFLRRVELGSASLQNVFLWWLLAMLLTVSQVTAQTNEAVDGVTVIANAYDPDISEDKGCPPDGCKPDKTRDEDLEGISRWSCKRELVEEAGGADGEECQIEYVFSGALDIYSMWVAFYEGNTRTRTMSVEVNGEQFKDVMSNRESEDLQEFVLNAEGVSSLALEAVGLEDDDPWLSIIEVKFYVVDTSSSSPTPTPAPTFPDRDIVEPTPSSSDDGSITSLKDSTQQPVSSGLTDPPTAPVEVIEDGSGDTDSATGGDDWISSLSVGEIVGYSISALLVAVGVVGGGWALCGNFNLCGNLCVNINICPRFSYTERATNITGGGPTPPSYVTPVGSSS